jgi:dTDP-4-dehydrorhamnose reductase/2-polyprenyl-3-methyl-5-hydroxy-6-metoxy-1,4-benzoquinol methylase
MKVLVLGASGIIGQHMRLCVPEGIEPVWVRHHADPITRGYDLTNDPIALFADVMPDVIVNLAGESNVDLVEQQQRGSINVWLPMIAAHWAKHCSRKFIQVSSQASTVPLVNRYGGQKEAAERAALYDNGVVVRPTFVLGLRPLPHVGRRNPLEAFLAGQSPQVADRWFSPLLAQDAASLIWDAVLNAQPGELRELGEPIRTTRFDLARIVNPDVTACSHDDFEGLAPRPKDTSYSASRFIRPIAGLPDVIKRQREDDRAIELALFFGTTLDAARQNLTQGYPDRLDSFHTLHRLVAEDFRAHNPASNEELLAWYRQTNAYIWELSAYHETPGFNYSGMCSGIAERLKAEDAGVGGTGKVLCLGDGIGDLTLTLHRAGINAIYHDLAGSRTAAYAAFRHWRQTGEAIKTDLSDGWAMPTDSGYDAICSLDFLEHVPNVEEWVRSIHAALVPGGLFCAQNAFACGSGADGSIPMHLAVNDRFERDWDPLLASIGFNQISSNWYRKAER